MEPPLPASIAGVPVQDVVNDPIKLLHAALVYDTFWIEKVKPKDRGPFMQLPYAQVVILDFPILAALPKVVNLGWPQSRSQR